MADTKRSTRLRMSWDASVVEVGSITEAIRKARELSLTWFDLDEWQTKEGWAPLGTWGKVQDGKFVSIPASEGNE